MSDENGETILVAEYVEETPPEAKAIGGNHAIPSSLSAIPSSLLKVAFVVCLVIGAFLTWYFVGEVYLWDDRCDGAENTLLGIADKCIDSVTYISCEGKKLVEEKKCIEGEGSNRPFCRCPVGAFAERPCGSDLFPEDCTIKE